MNPDSYIKNDVLSIIVKPNASKTEVIGWEESHQALKIAVSAPRVSISLGRGKNLADVVRKLTGWIRGLLP